MKICKGEGCNARHEQLRKTLGPPRAVSLVHGDGQCWHVAKHDKNYTMEAALAHYDYEEEVKAIAARAFNEHVIPFCDKHGLWLVQAMNAYEGDKVFGWPGERERGTSTDWDDFLKNPVWYKDTYLEKDWPKLPEGYEEMMKLVNQPLPHDDETSLLWYMPEYKPERKETSGAD